MSFAVDTDPDVLPEPDTETGIELGLGHFAVLADGTKADSPRFLRRAEKKLKKVHETLSRKAKGSNNRATGRAKAARQRVRVADQRRDGPHKPSTTLIRDNRAVYVENLAV
ncbi:transposase [Streptomyces sp. NPDC056632]|uniref:transposase n=1 Tax=Streptomyces sp. NPDC056632 TaxID=3345884 RepID=UPI003684B8B4